MATTGTKMTDHMSICAQDPNSPVKYYKPRKLNKLLHPHSSKSEYAGRQDPEAKKMRQNARETEDASKQSWESRRSQDLGKTLKQAGEETAEILEVERDTLGAC